MAECAFPHPRSLERPLTCSSPFFFATWICLRLSVLRGADRSWQAPGPPSFALLGTHATETSCHGEYSLFFFDRFAYYVLFQNGIAALSSATMPW